MCVFMCVCGQERRSIPPARERLQPAACYTGCANSTRIAAWPLHSGRCYELRCASGPVLGNDFQPLPLQWDTSHSRGTRGRGWATFGHGVDQPYLASINESVLDDFGR